MSWLSGPCLPEDEPPAPTVSDETVDQPERPAVRWVDSGSGPGYEVPAPADRPYVTRWE